MKMKPLDPRMDSDRSSVGSRDAVGSTSNFSQSQDDDHFLFRGIVSGEEGVLAIVDFLWGRFRLEPRLRRYISQCRVSKLAVALRTFLELTFEGRSEWPPLQLQRDEMTSRTQDVLEVLCDVVRKPLPLGEDVLDCGVAILARQAKTDERVMAFFTYLQSCEVKASVPETVPEQTVLMQDRIEEQVVPENLDQTVEPSANDSVTPDKTIPVETLNVPDFQAIRSARRSVARTLTQSGDVFIETQTLEDLDFDPAMLNAVKKSWSDFLALYETRAQAGEELYATIFENAPVLQALFKQPRSVQAVHLVNGLDTLVTSLGHHDQFRTHVQALAFTHLNIELNVQRIGMFRDAIIELFILELHDAFTDEAQSGWRKFMNHVGGAMIYFNNQCQDRLQLLAESWRLANAKTEDHQGESTEEDSVELVSKNAAVEEEKPPASLRERITDCFRSLGSWRPDEVARQVSQKSEGGQQQAEDSDDKQDASSKSLVPTTFTDMFFFNSAVLGFTASLWMLEVLACFDGMVQNASNPVRLAEECDVLALRMSNVTQDKVNLTEFKGCMMASLRALLPKVWTTHHEDAWSWLWSTVEQLLQKVLGTPAMYMKALDLWMRTLDDEQRHEMRKNIYLTFFETTPVGQDYFISSNTRLHFIADLIFRMTLELYREPVKVADEISAIGLRHVGYGIPTELFGPYVSASIEVVSKMCADKLPVDAFSWSLALISKMLVRVVTQGSTHVMKAINANSPKQLQKALAPAPRSQRTSWVLVIQVGNQSISPLAWAIESGSLLAADAILKDLLCIRADREKYYYGAEELFTRHPDIIKILCNDAPALLPTLLEGLVWRARNTKNGMRRANYYVKHLLITADGEVSQALKYLADNTDLKIISHPVITLVSEACWRGVVRKQFLFSKIGFMMSLALFMTSQAILPNLPEEYAVGADYAILGTRCLVYTVSMGRLALNEVTSWMADIKGRDFLWMGPRHLFPLPRHLKSGFGQGALVLLVLLNVMIVFEPLIACAMEDDWPTTRCDAAVDTNTVYTYASLSAMLIHWLLLIDMAVFSTKLSAFVLVCYYVMPECARFLVALSSLILTFGSMLSVLTTVHEEFGTVQAAVVGLFAMTLGIHEADYREYADEPVLLATILLFIVLSGILLLNLLIAQLNRAYELVYQDMVGFARMNRSRLVVDILGNCPKAKWSKFVKTLKLDQNLEFNEGDIGLPGGLPVQESASVNIVVKDQILRFGGSTSAEMQWPEHEIHEEEEDRVARIERILEKTRHRLASQRRQGRHDHDERSDDSGSIIEERRGRGDGDSVHGDS